MEVLKVSAIIVTRGDVDLSEVLASLPADWERVVWDNGRGVVSLFGSFFDRAEPSTREHASPETHVEDLAVYGRYAAIEHATGELIYVQDDDVVVSDPMALVRAWYEAAEHPDNANGDHVLVANMPQEFRHAFYEEHCLVGFGAVFHRDAPERAFKRFLDGSEAFARDTLSDPAAAERTFDRTCDVVFTALTPRVLVDVPRRNLPWATAPNRMYMTGGQHVSERMRMLELARKVRDA